MSDYVEVTRKSLGSRGKDSIGGAFFGVILVIGAAVLLFWNEGRAVKRYKDLKEGAGAVVTIPSDRIDPAMENRLVHLTGETKTASPLTDPDFGISLSAVKLLRQSQIYQWVEEVRTETRTKTGGGTEQVKTYTYDQEWSSSPVDSSRFKVPSGHQNPKEMKYPSKTFTADSVTLGAFTLPAFLVGKIGGAVPHPPASLDLASEEVRTSARIDGDHVYFGANPDAPAVGDVRVRFSSVPTGPVSVVAQQKGATFVPYSTRTGGTVDLLELGTVSAADMFQKAQDRATMLTWAFRVGGFLLLAFSFSLILRPIAVLAGILPFLGRLVGTGTTIVAFLLSGVVWTFTVAVAWVFYRPVLGIGILVVTLVLFVLVIRRMRNSRENPSPPPLAAGPPPLA